MVPDGSVTAKKLAPNAVTKSKLKNGSVTSLKIRNGNVRSVDLADGAKPAGGNFDGDIPQEIPLLIDKSKIIGEITLGPPAPGIVIVNTSGYLEFESGRGTALCSITLNESEIDTSNRIRTEIVTEENESIRAIPFAGTRGFDLSDSEEAVVRLVCSREAGGKVAVMDGQLTAIYVPQTY